LRTSRSEPRRPAAAVVVLVTLALVGLVGGAPSARAARLPRAGITDASVTRTATGQYVISWTAPAKVRVTSVYWGGAPEQTDRVLVATVPERARDVVVDDPSPGTRPYFELRTDGGARRKVAERRVALEGDPNFRDLGGYETKDGRVVRWGRLYRSGELDELTDADLATIQDLGIKLVCDLRSPSEIEIGPDRLPAGVETVRIPVVDDSVDPVVVRNAVLAGDVSALGEPGELLTDGNRKFVTDYTDEYAQVMARIMDPRYQPANLHCTAGKDRAGLGAAIVLLTLGVPEKTVMEDYLLTNEYRAAANERSLSSLQALLDPAEVEVVRGILDVREEYLDAALDTMKAEHGSIDAYIRDGLGITDKARAQFQRRMLDRPTG
jgi:protein-tyrosine phosphatase